MVRTGGGRPQWHPASPTRRAIEVRNKVEPPRLDGSHNLSGAEAFDHLCPREPVSQPLPVRISHNRECFQERDHDVCARQEQKSVAFD